MATQVDSKIPDIDSSNVSFLAYYNLTEEVQEGSSFEPSQLNFGTDMNERYDTGKGYVYNNGYKFTIDDAKMYSTITIRAGNDDHRWITAHIDNYENGGEFTGSGKDLKTYNYKENENFEGGEYDIIPWKGKTSPTETTDNTLFNAIEFSLNQTDYWTKNNLTIDNTGLYNYSVANESQNTSIFSSGTGTSQISFTDSTTIHKSYIVGSGNVTDEAGTTTGENVTFYINDTKCIRQDLDDPYNKDMEFALDVTEVVAENKQLSTTLGGFYADGAYTCIIVWS